MAAYGFFTATTTNLFLEHIKTKAEAYGWTIDFFGLYSGNNRLHLHNADGAHFEIWYYNSSQIIMRGCTGYDSGAAPTAQPGTSESCTFGNGNHLIIVGEHSIFIKATTSGVYQNIQFGYVADKIGSWTGGTFISSTNGDITSYNFTLWQSYVSFLSQVYINGAWTTHTSANGGAVYGLCESELYTKMPFAYSGGLLPCPILLVRINPSTTAYREPLGYAPDVRFFNGGNVYASLEEIVIDGKAWVGVSQYEKGVTFADSPDLLIRLAA